MRLDDLISKFASFTPFLYSDAYEGVVSDVVESISMYISVTLQISGAWKARGTVCFRRGQEHETVNPSS